MWNETDTYKFTTKDQDQDLNNSMILTDTNKSTTGWFR